jgi:hypothetical protein
MAVELITKSGRPMSSGNFMRLMKSILTDGKLDGCGISSSGANITVAAGRIVAGGALVVVESTTVTAIGAGELVLKIDTNAGTASILARAAVTLTQQDITGTGTVYEVQLATFGFTSGSVSGLTVIIGTAKPVGCSSSSITCGTAAPSGGSDGDIYFRIES